MTQKYSSYLLLFFCVVFGAYLRITGLANFPFSPDEHLNILMARLPLALGFASNNHELDAPFMLLVLHNIFRLGVSPNISRIISLLPGILLIPVVYFWGKQTLHRLSGLFMAFITTFATGPVMLSQQVRQYSLFLLFTALAFISLEIYISKRKTIYLVWFSFLALLSVAAQHSALLIWSLVFIIWFIHVPQKIFWFFAHLPYLVMFIFNWYTQGRFQWHNSLHYYFASSSWLKDAFIVNLDGIILQTHSLFSYFSPPGNVFIYTFFICFILGLYFLSQKRSRYFWLVLLIWLSSLVLSILRIYPYTGSRHLIHLYLPFLFLASSGFVYIFRHHQLLAPLFFLILIFFTSAPNYYRLSLPLSTSEFPLTYQESDQFFRLLHLVLQPGDIILTDRSGGAYFASQDSYPTYSLISNPIGHSAYANHSVFFTNDWLSDFSLSRFPTFSSRIVIVHLGWLPPTTLPTSLSYHRKNAGYSISVLYE